MYLLSVCDHTQRSQPSALFRIVFVAFLFPLSVEYQWSSEWASQIFLVALLAYVRRWCVFCLTTIMKQFVDSEGRFIPVDLKIDNKIIATGKIYALNSVILNFFFPLRLLNNTLLHGVVTILTIVYSTCVVQFFSHRYQAILQCNQGPIYG